MLIWLSYCSDAIQSNESVSNEKRKYFCECYAFDVNVHEQNVSNFREWQI